MNSKACSLFGSIVAITLPVSAALAGGHHGGVSFSRPASAGRPAVQSRPAFRGGVGTFQRPNYNWAGTNRLNNFSTINRTGLSSRRVGITSTAINRNQFRGNTNSFSSSFNGTNRFRGVGSNHSSNWWRRHHGCDNSFVFFGGFGFPFFGAWDYGYYPGAYYPYYAYTPYSYDPYGYSNYGYPAYGYPANGDGGYSDDPQYDRNPAYDDQGRADDGQRYQRGNDSIVAQVQQRLARAGFYKGDVDGIQGSRTYYAIRAYQREHNLPVTGRINDQLLDEMGLR